MSNPIIQAEASIGQISAEADGEFLFDCFVEHPTLVDLKNPKSPKMFLLGSTGIGKTALLRIIERNVEKVHSIELDDLSLTYISNSNVISFLADLEVPLDHFFQALWKHVICVEYIKLRYGVNSEEKSAGFVSRVRDRFVGDPAKQRALKYLTAWENKFWVSIEESIKEITKSLEDSISANFGAELAGYQADAGFVRKMKHEKKSQLVRRLKSYVDADLLSELSQVIKLLADHDDNNMATCYVLIDRLDENWVGTGVRYKLIRSLIEALKSMRRVTSLKVVVALRSDLLEKVILETREDGFQSEKYEDYTSRIRWSAEDLKVILNKRINFLFRRKYTQENVFFENIFPAKIHREKTTSFILDRTLMRPRDAITFVNFCLSEAAGKSEVTQTAVKNAEKIYSHNRLEAMIDEWRGVFPAIEPTLSFLRGRSASFHISELLTSRLPEQLLDLFFAKESYQVDPITAQVDQAVTDGGDHLIFPLAQTLVERLHLVGAIGVNSGAEEPIHWFYKTRRRLSKDSIRSDSKLRIHPMVHSALAIR